MLADRDVRGNLTNQPKTFKITFFQWLWNFSFNLHDAIPSNDVQSDSKTFSTFIKHFTSFTKNLTSQIRWLTVGVQFSKRVLTTQRFHLSGSLGKRKRRQPGPCFLEQFGAQQKVPLVDLDRADAGGLDAEALTVDVWARAAIMQLIIFQNEYQKVAKFLQLSLQPA
jgi:hypothetical protein